MFSLLLSVTEPGTISSVVPLGVALITIVPSTMAAISSRSNKREIEKVRYEVSPNGGSSSFDLTHRLLWEVHEKVSRIPELVERVERLEDQKKKESSK